MKKRGRLNSVTGAGAAVETVAKPAAFTHRHATILAIALVAIATVRIVLTYGALGYTYDEPAHLACGIEWLEKHTYTLEAQHPPLARVMTALLPRLFGARSAGRPSLWPEGLAILASTGHPDATLTQARLGTLPFFWIVCWIAFAWTRRISSHAISAVAAIFLLTMTPAILAHAGLATTDMGLTAMLLLAVYTGWLWIESPSLSRATFVGAATGLALVTKFSTLAFLPSIAIVALALWWYFERPAPRTMASFAAARTTQFGMAIAVASLVVWAAYRFSLGHTALGSFRVPAPEFFNGIQEVRDHNSRGNLTYLLGRVNTVGWPQFYAVALAVKAPLPLLAAGLAGLWLLRRRCLILAAVVLGILLFSSFFTNIRIGTRHVLPVFVAFAIAGGYTTTRLLDRANAYARYALAALALALAIPSLAAHPDYLGYFNLLAGSRPEAILVDSDLDWGQDVKRLGARLREIGAPEVYFNQYAPGDLAAMYGFPPIRPLDPSAPRPGWNAVSLTALKYGLFADGRYAYEPGYEFWPDRVKPDERIGSGILLFYAPPKPASR